MNFTPAITSASCRNPRSRRQRFRALIRVGTDLMKENVGAEETVGFLRAQIVGIEDQASMLVGDFTAAFELVRI